MRRKITQRVLSCMAAMAVFLTAGGGAITVSAEETTEEASAVSAEDLEYVELTWYIQSDSKDVDIIQEALDEYFLEKLNCKVTLKQVGLGEVGDVMPTKLMSGEEIDLVSVYADLPYSTYANMGAFYPIDELWDEYAPDIEGLFQEGVWNSLEIDGHIYAVPTLKDNAYIMGYIYNTTLAEDLGLDMENSDWKNFGDMEEYLTEALAIRNEKYPEYADMPLVSAMPSDFPYFCALERFTEGVNLAVCNIPGKEAVTSKGADEVYNFYETDEYREIILKKQRLTESGVAAYDYETYGEYFSLRNEYSTLVVPCWGYCWIDEGIFGGDEFSSKLVLFDDPWTDTSNYTTAMMAIGANCKNPERAMMVMNLLNTDSYVATLLRFGVEGEHWEYDSDGKMQMTNRNADVSSMGWLEWYGIGLGNLTIVDGPESYLGPDGALLQTMAECNDNAILASHMGFTLDTSSIQNEISACSNVISEYEYLSNGQVESADAVNQLVDEFVAKLKANGSDKIVEEAQRQLDEWLANNG